MAASHHRLGLPRSAPQQYRACCRSCQAQGLSNAPREAWFLQNRFSALASGGRLLPPPPPQLPPSVSLGSANSSSSTRSSRLARRHGEEEGGPGHQPRRCPQVRSDLCCPLLPAFSAPRARLQNCAALSCARTPPPAERRSGPRRLPAIRRSASSIARRSSSGERATSLRRCALFVFSRVVFIPTHPNPSLPSFPLPLHPLPPSTPPFPPAHMSAAMTPSRCASSSRR